MFAICNSHVVIIKINTNEQKDNILLDGVTQWGSEVVGIKLEFINV